MFDLAKLITSFQIALVALCILALSPPISIATVSYSTSAHGDDDSGDTNYGVLRGGSYALPDIYARGNCGHCHEQHASIGGDEPAPDDGGPSAYLLLSGPTSGASEDTCFQCHGTGAVQDGGVITNKNYAATFGGEISPTATTIMEAFNLTYTHDLTSMKAGLATFSDGALSSNNSPCSGCHNVHIAKANWRDPDNTEQSAISLPTDHENLWGLDDGDAGTYETMKQYAEGNSATYRAPLYVGADPSQTSTNHEPDGTSGDISLDKVKGSTTPNYNEFCLECHQNAIGTRRAINWSSSGDNHGFGIAGVSMKQQGPRIAPYTSDGTSGTSYDGSTNFVLSCLDCHEPHGSSNFDLLRTTVNGSSVNTNTAMSQLCYSCHTQSGHGRATCTDCHSHNGRF